MIDWIIKHLDAITDNIQRVQHTQTYEDIVYIKKVVRFILWKIVKGIRFIIITIISFISAFFGGLILFRLLRG